MQLFWVSIIVLINILSVLATKYATNIPETKILFIIIILSSVLGINILKFFLWGYIHNRYPLSSSYPMAATFYPLMYFISIYYGEVHWEVTKTIGAFLIFGGAIIINRK